MPGQQPLREDLTGKRFGHIVVVSLTKKRNDRKRLWLCKCDCGGAVLLTWKHMRTRNVGCKNCLGIRLSNRPNNVHGELVGLKKNRNKNRSLLYSVWLSMKQRCSNPKNKKFHIYGGKGITVCEDWLDYGQFREWSMSNGYQKGLTIERNDPDKNYHPSNCEWITRSENGKRSTVTKMARKKKENDRKIHDYVLGQMGLAA